MQLCRPHLRPVKNMIRLGIFRRVSKNFYVVVNPSAIAPKIGELFVYNKAIYILTQELKDPYPTLSEVVGWVNDIEIVTYHEHQVGILNKGKKQVIRNIRKIYEFKFGSPV